MANLNGPSGLRLNNSGGKCSYLGEYSIASGYAVGLWEGDVVKLAGTGRNVIRAPVNDTDAIGVFKGCMYVNPQGAQVFSPQWPASQVATEIVALLYDDLDNYEFIAQTDTWATTDVGLSKTVSWTIAGGNTRTGLSGMTLDVASATTGSPLIIKRLAPLPKNAAGAYAKVLVKFIEHANASS